MASSPGIVMELEPPNQWRQHSGFRQPALRGPRRRLRFIWHSLQWKRAVREARRRWSRTGLIPRPPGRRWTPMRRPLSRSSSNSLYDKELVTFEEGRIAYDHPYAAGFIKLNALRLRVAAKPDQRSLPPPRNGSARTHKAGPCLPRYCKGTDAASPPPSGWGSPLPRRGRHSVRTLFALRVV
jgi:hypothetical protein